MSVIQNPTTSVADDVAVSKRTLAAQDGQAILVGHSGLAYVAAFAPDKGESFAQRPSRRS